MKPKGIVKMTAQHPAPQAAFRALADPTRREIIALLARSEMTIAQLSDRFPMTRAAVKKHLSILQDGGLIEVQPRGRERINRLHPDGLRPVIDWIARLDAAWDDRLTALQTAIAKETR
jgi:DNA-binding transcriptional ArsR family regulator